MFYLTKVVSSMQVKLLGRSLGSMDTKSYLLAQGHPTKTPVKELIELLLMLRDHF